MKKRKSRKESKKIGFINRIIPDIAPGIIAEIAPEIGEFIIGEDSFKQTVADIIEIVADGEKKEKRKEKKRIGYDLSDLGEFAKLVKFKKKAKKASRNYEDPIISDKEGAFIFMDDSQDEMRIYATIPRLGLNFKNIIWIGQNLYELTRNRDNVYQIRTEKYRIIYDRNKNEVTDFEEI